jgi:predicted outer membrane lipoprotein
LTTVVERRVLQQGKGRFYVGMSVAAAVITLVGFAPTFYLRGYLPMRPDQPPLSALLIVHGVTGTAWIALFLGQSLLVAAHRIRLHRRLGIVGGFLACALVIVGIMTAVDALRRDGGPFRLDARTWFLGVTLTGTMLFGILVAVALAKRRSRETHRRLMLLATITLLNPALGRLVGSYLAVGLSGFLLLIFLLTDVLVILAVLYDLRIRGNVHPALVRGGLAVVLVQPVVLALGTMPTFLRLADLFR